MLGRSAMVGDEVAVASVVPLHPPFPIVMNPALVSGEWFCLSNGYWNGEPAQVGGVIYRGRAPDFDELRPGPIA